MVLASSSSNELPPFRASAEACRATRRAPASSPRLGGSEPLRTPPPSTCVDDGPGRALELAHKRGAVRHELFREAIGALSRLGEELVDEKNRGLLGRAFSRVFSHLLNTNPDFDFAAAIAPVPEAIWSNLVHWVDDNVDALVRVFASNDDAMVVAADEGDVVDGGIVDGGAADGGVADGGEDSDNDGASSLPESDSGDGASDMSG